MVDLGRQVRVIVGYFFIVLGVLSIAGIFVLEIIGIIWALAIHDGQVSFLIWIEYTGGAIASLISALINLALGSVLIDMDDSYHESNRIVTNQTDQPPLTDTLERIVQKNAEKVVKEQTAVAAEEGVEKFETGQRVFVNGLGKTATIVMFEPKTSIVIFDSELGKEVIVDSKELRRLF